MAKIVIGPLTRIEGHLKIEVMVENGVVKDAKSSGALFRGFEILLRGRDPFDAQHLTQRICGVCPTAHASAAALNLDSAFGIADKVPENGRIIRNLIQGANFIMSHILHFYHLAALDYVDVTKVAKYDGKEPALTSVKEFIGRALDAGDMAMLGPFYPRYEGDYRLPDDIDRAAVSHYVQALNMRRLAHEMSAIFSGKMPHNVAIVPGGVTANPTVDDIADFMWKLQELRNFIDNVYIPDVLAVAEVYSDYFEVGKGCGNLLSFGVFDLETKEKNLARRKRLLSQGTTSAADLKYHPLEPSQITEDVKNSWYKSPSGLHPSQGQTEPDRSKKDAYSWVKAPRYNGGVYEVGPLARMAVTYAAGEPTVQKLVNDTLAHFGAKPEALFSVLGRHAARALECKFIADKMPDWLLELKPGEPVCAEWTTPDEGEGMGLWEAPRGVLGHWISIKDKKIANYQCVPPTNWNVSPRDDKGTPGPIEQALIGAKVKDESNPFEVVRIVRSFDP
jgi:hydrogenase large subunit